MEERIFIRRDRGAETQFLQAVEDTVKKGNELIRLFNSKQSFVKIGTLEEALSLIADPIGFYDQALIDNIKHDRGAPVRISRSKTLSLEQYSTYSKYVEFARGGFSKNSQAIEEHSDSFNIYASTPAQKEVYSHYTNLVNTLNEAIGYHELGLGQIQQLAGMFKLLVLDTKLVLNDIELSQTIKYM